MTKETITINIRGESWTLCRGSGNPSINKADLPQIAALLAGERYSDDPESISPVLVAFIRALWVPDGGLVELVPFANRLIGTSSRPDLDHRAAMTCLDWAVRVGPSSWLRQIGLDQTATELEALPIISSWEQMSRIKPALLTALHAARSAVDKSTRRETVVHFSGAYAPWAAAWKSAELQDVLIWEDQWYSTWRAMAIASRVMPLQDANRLVEQTHSEVIGLLDEIIKLWER